MYDGLAGNGGIPSESVDDQVDERESERYTKSSVEPCTSPSCLSPRASTDALLPSFQPDDVTSPQPSPSAEHPSRNYPGAAVTQFHRNRSPRSDEVYPAGVGHAYSGHSPRSGEVMPSSTRRSSFSEQVSRSSPRSDIVVEDLTTSYPKHDWAFVETQRDQQNRSPNLADSNMRREMIARSKMDLLRVDTSPGTISRQSRDLAPNHVSTISVIYAV